MEDVNNPTDASLDTPTDTPADVVPDAPVDVPDDVPADDPESTPEDAPADAPADELLYDGQPLPDFVPPEVTETEKALREETSSCASKSVKGEPTKRMMPLHHSARIVKTSTLMKTTTKRCANTTPRMMSGRSAASVWLKQKLQPQSNSMKF